MIVNNFINYNRFASNKIIGANYKTSVYFQNTLSEFFSNELLSNDNSFTLYSDLNNQLLSSQNCAICKEKIEDATQSVNDEITENIEEAKDIFTICFECANKEECEHYQKMINGDESVQGNAVFSPIRTSKSFHKNEVTMQEQ